jgi:hypothetical protein
MSNTVLNYSVDFFSFDNLSKPLFPVVKLITGVQEMVNIVSKMSQGLS